jgi:hypothetical protein
MDSLFWLSYGLLWVSVVGLGLLVFLLFREIGRIYLGQSSSFTRDGVDIGRQLPDLSVQTPTASAVLSDLTAGSAYATVLVTRNDCSFCTEAADAVDRAARRSPKLGGVILVDGTDFGPFGSYDDQGGCNVGLLREGDVGELKIRATPFALLVDGDLTVLAKGILNTDRDVSALVERASNEAGIDLQVELALDAPEGDGRVDRAGASARLPVHHVGGRNGDDESDVGTAARDADREESEGRMELT